MNEAMKVALAKLKETAEEVQPPPDEIRPAKSSHIGNILTRMHDLRASRKARKQQKDSRNRNRTND